MANEVVEIDDLDRAIIDQLRADGRASFSDIARAVGVAEPTARARYGRLARKGIIQVVGMSDANRTGEISAHIGIKVRHLPVAIVARELSRIAEVRFVASAVGPYELFCDVRTDSVAHLSDLLVDRIRRVTGVAGVDTLLVLEVLVDSYVWTGFREPGPRVTGAILPPP